MTPENKLKIQNILIIIGIGLIFGLVYNFLFYPHTLTEFIEAGSISILISLLVGILEEFVLKNTFQNKPFLTVSIIRAFTYSILVSIVLCLVLSIEISFSEELSYAKAVAQYLMSPLFPRDFVFSFTFIILILFTLEILLLVGRANFFRLLLGSYHQPREISRIFMFIDLNDSTSIAERLSNKTYSSFIKDYFYDVSDAILMFNGEIYQYVGDEIIVVWPIGNKKPTCVQCFFKMMEIIDRKRGSYQSKYGLVPRFKAGIHGGRVVVTSVGKQKKEIVYHGDVLNTTSRIEGMCLEFKRNLLISGQLLNYIDLEDDYIIEEIGKIKLKGKADKLVLYGVKAKAENLV